MRQPQPPAQWGDAWNNMRLDPLGSVEPFISEGIGIGYGININNLESQYRTHIDHHGNVVRIRDSNPRGRDGPNHRHNRAITDKLEKMKKKRLTVTRILIRLSLAIDIGDGLLCDDTSMDEAILHGTGRTVAMYIGGKLGGQ